MAARPKGTGKDPERERVMRELQQRMDTKRNRRAQEAAKRTAKGLFRKRGK